MNLSPDNRTTLETLLASLGNGVTGSQAAPILQATLAAQAQQQDARNARYQQMATDVASMAGQGLTQGAVSNYVDTMTRQSGIPGKFQGLIDSAFQGAEVPQSISSSQYTHGLYAPQNNPQLMSQLQSPMFTQNPQSTAYATGTPQLLSAPQQAQFAGMMAQPAPPSPDTSDLMGQALKGINDLKVAGFSPEEIAAAIQQDPANLGIIMENSQEFMLAAPDVMAVLMPEMPGL